MTVGLLVIPKHWIILDYTETSGIVPSLQDIISFKSIADCIDYCLFVRTP